MADEPEQEEKPKPDTSGRDRRIGLFVKITFFVVLVIGILALVVISKYSGKANSGKANSCVEKVSLTQFDFGSKNTTLQFNLALEIAVRNTFNSPIYFDKVEVSAYYNGQRFDTKTLTPFSVPHKSSLVLNPVFQGKSSLSVGAAELYDELLKEGNKNKGPNYNIGVKLDVKFRYAMSLWIIKSHKSTMHICFMVPLDHHSQSTFETTNCVASFSD